MIEQARMCQMCHQRSEVGEFRAGRGRMIDGLEKTGAHKSADKAPTDFTYFTCRDCGERWMLTEDASLAKYLSRRPHVG